MALTLAQMRELLGVAIVTGLVSLGCVEPSPARTGHTEERNSDQTLAAAFERRASSLQVEGQGEVIRLLSDDREGGRHQRFILRLASGQTLLVAHNIDLAPRVSDVREGDTVQFFGEYEWNPQGGVLHWTHRDPDGRHVPGWLRHQGRTYQ